MKFFTLLLSVVFLAAGISAVNGKLVYEQQHGKTLMAPKPAVKPTAAALMTPTKAPKVQFSSTKSNEKTTNDEETKIDVLPIEMPATVDHPLQAEESQHLAVTGFITKNGNIYEIQDKNGIGKIQSRQADDEGQHICNYGAVVIYSDVPCEQVTKVKVSEIEDKPTLDQAPVQQMQQENKPAENNSNKPSDDKENLDGQKRPDRRRLRRPSNKRRNNKNKNSNLKTQKRNGQKRPNNTNKNNNRQLLQQKRRRQQQQQQFNRRKWEQEEDDDDYYERQHQYEYNRRRWEQDEDDDDDERQFKNQRQRKQNKSKKRQQAQRYTTDYYDDDY